MIACGHNGGWAYWSMSQLKWFRALEVAAGKTPANVVNREDLARPGMQAKLRRG